MKKKSVLISILVLVLILTTVMYSSYIEFQNAKYDPEIDKFVGSFGWIYEMINLMIIYIAEIDLFYVAWYFLVRKLNKNKVLLTINVIALVISTVILFLEICMLLIVSYWEMEFFWTFGQIFDAISICIWFYILIRVIYAIINVYAVRGMLVE